MERTKLGKNILGAATLLGVALMLVTGVACETGRPPGPPPGPECETNADCDDANWCNGEETCVDGDCVDGTAPCTENQRCDEDADVCIDICETADDCPDDGNPCTDATCVDGDCGVENNTADCDDGDACTDPDVCSNGVCTAGTAVVCSNGLVCDPATGDCVECLTDADCDPGYECTANVCVAVTTEFAITGCPTEDVNNGEVLTFGVEYAPVAANTAWYVWDFNGVDFTTNGAATASWTATASGTVTVTFYDYTDGLVNTNGAWDPGEEDDAATDTADCVIEAQFTTALLVEAGDLVDARSVLATYVSGTPGTAGNNALNGTANQQGVDPDAIATEWTVESKPGGSGAVTFSNAAQLATAYNVGAPASAGNYVFHLTATNENTGETNYDEVTLTLLDVPQIRLLGTDVARRNVEYGNTVTMNVEYNVTDTTSFSIWAKETAATAAGTANQTLLATVAVTGTAGAWVGDTIDIDTSTLDEGAGTFLLGWSATDSVGLIPVGGLSDQLAKANADEAVAGRRGAAVIMGRAKTTGTLAAVTTGAAVTNPAEPVGLTLATEVGTPVSVGTGFAIQAFGAGQVIYPGMGDTASGAIAHTPGSMVLGYDVNGDGVTDVCYASAGNIEVLFGAVDLLTDNGGAATALIGQGAAGGAAAAVAANANQDWGAAGAYAANERTQLAIAGAGLVDLAIGDCNQDGNLDFVFLGDNAALGACGFVFMPGNATGDPMTNAVQLVYTAAGAGAEVGGACGSADFDGDGIDDGCYGVPAATLGRAAVVYGQAMTGTTLNSGFAATNTLVLLAGANKFLYSGQNAADLAGAGLIVADVTGGDSADLIFEQRLVNNVAGTGIIGVVAGANNTDQPDVTTPTFAIGDPTAGDFIGASLATGNLTGAAKADLVVGAPGYDTAASTGAVNEGTVYVIPSASLANAAINALAGTFSINNNRVGVANNQLALGVAVGVFDYDGDGDDDLIAAHNAVANSTVYVAYGPVAGTGLNFNDTQNGFGFRLEAATAVTQIAAGDVNGDALDDLCLFGANTGVVLVGLE